MEKTKAELYLEKVQKWREQKMKEKEDRLKNKQKPSKPVTAAVVKPISLKPVSVKPSVKLVKSSNAAVSKAAIDKKPRISGVKATPKILSKATGKVEKKRKSAETRELIEKLNKWREEKKSERKQIQKSAISKAATKPIYKEVRSRLFDYQSKPKPHINSTISQKDKENVFSSSRKTGVASKSTARKGEVSKVGVKRRHSEVQKAKSHSKPVGILKRKSCIGSFDLTDGYTDRSSAKRRRTVCSVNSERNETIQESNLIENNEPKTDDSNVLSGQLPTAVVTPGVSTRNVRFSTPPNDHSHVERKRLRKTPKTPATRSAELSDWLKAKGRTPSKFRHLMCFHGDKAGDGDKSQDTHTKNMLSVEELSEQMDVLEQERLQAEAVNKMNSMLDECMLLFEAGCPTESIVPWLDDIYKQIPCSHTSARFYTCKANVMKYSLDLDAVLEIFEQATINNAQPKEEIAKCLTETLKYVIEGKMKKEKRRCRTPRRSEVQEENVFESSAVVYTVSNVTPFSEGKRSSSKRPSTPAQCQVVTPVRRSTRRSLQSLPESLKDKKKSFSNLDEVKGEDVLFQPNLALDTVLATMEES